MNEKKNYRFDTQVIHAGQSPEDWQWATLPPIYQTASHLHPTAENLTETFAGKRDDHIYMRLTNPTNRVLEEKLATLEGGPGAIVMSSGMAAITNTCMALLRAGDEFVTGNSLFVTTYNLFIKVFSKYGITARLVESTDTEAIEKAINSKTRFVYLETIGNPKMDVPDLDEVASIAHRHGVPLVVDNTLPTPYLLRPLELGADVVMHSTTKYLSGHGGSMGGVVIDGGNFTWSPERFPDFKAFIDRKGPLALLDKIWRELRMERHLENTMKVAHYLKERPEVLWVNYPGLEDHPSHGVALKEFGGKGFGGMLTFGLTDQAACFRFINSLQMIYNLANLGDSKTLVIHPYSSQYYAQDEPTRKALSIPDNMIRFSTGIEAVEDICEDISQALNRL
jgi:O-acetylhomoserine (thiol)-lyase